MNWWIQGDWGDRLGVKLSYIAVEHGAVLDFFFQERIKVNSARCKLIEAELFFPEFPSLNNFPWEFGTGDVLCEMWRVEVRQQSHRSLQAQKVGVETSGSVVVQPCFYLLFGLGQQVGRRLLYFPLDSPSASSTVFRLVAMRSDFMDSSLTLLSL